MHTAKRMAALRASGAYLPTASAMPPGAVARAWPRVAGHRAEAPNPACVVGPGQRCEHALVDAELNRRLSDYERTVRGRFAAIVDVLKDISALQHEADFAPRAQQLARTRLGYCLPQHLLEDAWVSGLDMRALHSHCIFESFKACVDATERDQAPWREHMALTPDLIAECGFHTVDVSPCADGRLQGLLPFALRMAPNRAVRVKAYAGAMFDVEDDIADWAHRELQRLTGAIDDGGARSYLKVAVYHFSSSRAGEQGCAFHASDDGRAVAAAAQRLGELRAAIERSYADDIAPVVLLVGLDTDLDALRIHPPNVAGKVDPHRLVDTAELYRQTVGLPAQEARACFARQIDRILHIDGEAPAGQNPKAGDLRRLLLALVEANLSQIEYVIHHHQGRYAVIGHDEEFICVGEALDEVQLRNLNYHAHLDTLEEGAADMDVGIRIFTGLNLRHGLPVPVLVHFQYSSPVPGSRERAVRRARRVKAAIEARFAGLAGQGLLVCRMAVSDRCGDERCTFVADDSAPTGH